MWRRKSDEIVEFLFVFFQVGQSCPYNNPAHTMSDKADFAEWGTRAVLSDIIIDFLSKAYSHLANIPLRMIFIGTWAEEHNLRE